MFIRQHKLGHPRRKLCAYTGTTGCRVHSVCIRGPQAKADLNITYSQDYYREIEIPQ